MTKFTARWASRTDIPIAEAAEALAVPTDCVMAVGAHQGHIVALWTPEHDDPDDPTIYGAELKRGTDGVLFLAGEPVEQVGMWDKIKAHIEERLGREEL